MTEFEIIYNHGRGRMTLNLENFFARNAKGVFVHTYKTNINKVLALVAEWCEEEQITFLLDWLTKHNCKDLVDAFLKKYKWVNEFYPVTPPSILNNKEKTNMENINTLRPGERFMYKGLEWIALDLIDGNILAITSKAISEIPFDTGRSNNWKNSSLRRVLNNDFLAEKLDKRHLVPMVLDLTADNGDDMYGKCEDYVGILSCDQVRKYRKLIPGYPEWMWTCTPWYCSPDPSDAHFVRSVLTSGVLYYSVAYDARGVVPACIFSSKHLKLCRQAQLVEAD